ncbi:alanine--tRNA ligase [Blochmannia endosymbiont of Camponotus (Colobopsis) obliquus]|uniref:alanine--tRNA ligase n=1 Tax=Blochmannia endosymbiont of Camponotus (Colobopsis) obliquus TaxID=1505597 RepID=UPI00061A7C60|nr:alanine--tRNA ligase [Blochmannia endosymbiont of Camponotus (Colobopsis) obliquus]AKC60344.1 alanine--tRNA ligase [Blochmannia endosymbiont of Camponotus (Colobopsis) obliquus]
MSKSTVEIRQAFLDFFCTKGHYVFPSSSLIPDNDPSILFTNAGMNQFKNMFLGLEQCLHNRIVTIQRCIRVGGKHNDLNQVGYTPRHHTFFEMLGNFSFGDYFKYDAIKFSWELLTSKYWFNLPKDRLWTTVYDSDDESYNIWLHEIGISPQHIIRIGDNKGGELYDSDNFWQMGDFGLCGPCSEIFYDQGDHIWGGLPGTVEAIGDRYVEIWNLVFLQFDRQINGELLPLSIPSVDTGMGLERIAAILQSVDNNYHIDLFRKLIVAISQIVGVTDLNTVSLRIIADHIRSCTFLISDGVVPSNEGRGYVLRRIIRRAILHGKKLCVSNIFFYKLVEPVIDIMGFIIHGISLQQKMIEDILCNEEKKFVTTLQRGMDLLNITLSKLTENILDGKTAFYLYNTYGLPLEFTLDICREHGIKVDDIGFHRAMLIAQQNARNFSNFNYSHIAFINKFTKFVGYDQFEHNSKVIALFKNNHSVKMIGVNDEACVVLDITPFYSTGGGQVGDCGELNALLGIFKVIDVQRIGQVIVHQGKMLSGVLNVGDHVLAKIDKLHRLRVSLNHSATHLLHSALNYVLNINVLQKGSFISEKYLRFDFAYDKEINFNQICLIEDFINQQIRCNLSVVTRLMSLDVALSKGVKVLSGEKYNAHEVRVLSIGNVSSELCGGTHVDRTGNIGLFIITAVFGIALGVRRIEAVTGNIALSIVQQNKSILQRVSHLLKIDNKNIVKKVSNLLNYTQQLEKEVKFLKNQIIFQKSMSLINCVRYIKDVQVLISHVKNVDINMLRNMVDNLKDKLISGIIILAIINRNDKVNFVVGVTKDLMNRIDAVKILSFLSSRMQGGKGGGHPGLAQGGGYDKVFLSAALISVDAFLAMSL